MGCDYAWILGWTRKKERGKRDCALAPSERKDFWGCPPFVSTPRIEEVGQYEGAK